MVLTFLFALQTAQQQAKIELLVERCQLKSKGLKYCQLVTNCIMRSAQQIKIDPLIVATTAYHESRFSMASSPQMGIMQFTHSTWRGNFGRRGTLIRGLDPKKIEHNILAGTAYLKGHLQAHKTERGMWLGYNGSYRKQAYTAECQRTVKRLRTWDQNKIGQWLTAGKEL
jgi:soluble lytic murein transglycosylase-like protein